MEPHEKRHHIIISGTGRAGTTFLVKLFTMLGLDTGFTKDTAVPETQSNAGLEWAIEHPDAPYIVKQPTLCDRLESIVLRDDIVIDHAIIPRRPFFEAAESRRHNARMTPQHCPSAVVGGLFGTDSLERGDQEAVLERKLNQLMDVVHQYRIPFTELSFPDEIEDAERLYEKLSFMLVNITKEEFLRIHKEVWKPALVHKYGDPSFDLMLARNEAKVQAQELQKVRGELTKSQEEVAMLREELTTLREDYAKVWEQLANALDELGETRRYLSQKRFVVMDSVVNACRLVPGAYPTLRGVVQVLGNLTRPLRTHSRH